MTLVFTVDFPRKRLRLGDPRPHFFAYRHTTPSCGGHSLQRDKTADVVDEVLEADFGLRPNDANRPYDPTTRRALLSSEHVLDASPNHALFAVCILLRLR